MRARLPAFYLVALDSRSPLKRDDLQRCSVELTIAFKQQFDLVFPPLNAPLLSFKFVRDLGLPRKSLVSHMSGFI
jgi:RNA polymerase I-specific transcription initiation factor RRN7